MPKKAKKIKRSSVVVGVKADGSPAKKWFQYTSEREKEAIRKKLIDEANGVVLPAKGIMFDSYAREWLKLRKSRAASTQRLDKTAIETHLIPAFRGRTLASITRVNVQEIFDDLGERYKYNTVASYYRVVKGIFESAHNDGLIRVRPDVSVVLTGSDPRHRRPLTIEERKIATACDDIGILLLYYTGARISEAINITWADVDFVKKTIQIRGTKTSSAKREIPLLPELEAALLPMRGVGGKRIYGKSDATLRTAVEKLLPQITPHYMRHNYASLCKTAGVDVLTTSRWMGHSSVAITQDIYTHLDAENVAAEAAKLAASMQL